ncbi:MAG: hypothetical protein AABY18_06765 [Candidatus Thermoplasmatota archaeon]
MQRLAAVLLLAALAGCAQPLTGADVEVAEYLISRDNDLLQQASGGGVSTATCAVGKHVHLLMLEGAADWTDPAGWRVLVGETRLIAVEVDLLQGTLYVYACLSPGETVSRLRYERGSEVLATAVVDIEPTMAS